jgi:hypothetical protein
LGRNKALGTATETNTAGTLALAPPPVVRVGATRIVGQLTGGTVDATYTPNHTTTQLLNNTVNPAAYPSLNVGSVDQGIMWDDGTGTAAFFSGGDAYGSPPNLPGSGSTNRRHNILAKTTTKGDTLKNGFTFSSWLTSSGAAADYATNAKPGAGVTGSAHIPMGGAAIPKSGGGYRQVVQLMAVQAAGVSSQYYNATTGEVYSWRTNAGYLIYSDDDGATWSLGPQWTNDTTYWNSYFQQCALVVNGNYLYMFGTGNGRSTDVKLGRVLIGSGHYADFLTLSNWEYWVAGTGWVAGSTGLAAATIVISGGIGEFSIQYNYNYKCWIMFATGNDCWVDSGSGHTKSTNTGNVFTGSIFVIGTARRLEGPWTDGRNGMTGLQYSGLSMSGTANGYTENFASGGAYGAFLHPYNLSGSRVQWNVSWWGPYQVFQYETIIGLDPVAVGYATETCSALPLGKKKSVGTATESDTAKPLGRKKALGTATETDTAGNLLRAKRLALGQALETCTAGAVGRKKALGRANETCTAATLGRKKALGTATETNTAGTLTRVRHSDYQWTLKTPTSRWAATVSHPHFSTRHPSSKWSAGLPRQ